MRGGGAGRGSYGPESSFRIVETACTETPLNDPPNQLPTDDILVSGFVGVFLDGMASDG